MGTKRAVLVLLTLCTVTALWGLGSGEKRTSGSGSTAPEAGSRAAPGGTEERNLPSLMDRNGPVSDSAGQITEGSGPVIVTGLVRLVGSGPRTEPVLSNVDGEWYFESADQKRMAELQQRTVTVEGTYYEETLQLVNSSYSFTRRVLRAVRITAIDGAPPER